MTRIEATETSEDRTAFIQAVLDGAGEIVFGPGVFLVSQLEVRSNTSIHLERGAVIRRKPGAVQAMVLHLGRVHDVLIEGGVVDGNSASAPSEMSHCLAIQGGRHITVMDIRLMDAPTSPAMGSYGDGLYLGIGHGGVQVSDCKFINVTSTGNDRHGASIISCVDSVFENCIFSDTKTNDPGSAINLESNDSTAVKQNVSFVSCRFETSEHGITINNAYDGAWKNIRFVNCTSRLNRQHGLSSDGHLSTKGLSFIGCDFEDNANNGFYVYHGIGVTISDCLFKSNGWNGMFLQDCRDISVSGSACIRNGRRGGFLHSSQVPFSGSVRGCQFSNNGTLGELYATAGLVVQCVPNIADVYLSVTGCHTGNSAHYDEASQQWGFEFQGAGNIQIANAIHVGNLIAPVKVWS